MAKKIKKKVDLDKIAQGVRLMLEGMGEDPTREGLQKTPERVADFYAELTEGMWIDASEHIVPLPGDSHDEMVIVKDISIASVCEHQIVSLAFGLLYRDRAQAITLKIHELDERAYSFRPSARRIYCR